MSFASMRIIYINNVDEARDHSAGIYLIFLASSII